MGLKRYSQIRNRDIANGLGIRVSIFVSGCTHHCEGCFNQEYKCFSYGKDWTDETTQYIIKEMSSSLIAGLTLIGGEPMDNLWIIDVVREVKKHIDKNIWIYSGYTYEQILADEKKSELLNLCDVLVDGEFIPKLHSKMLLYRGSSNQRIIDLNKTRETGELKILDLN